jgi:hypothetical protein
MVRYFEWLGAARYTADQRSSAMHGKQFLLDAIYTGIDESNLYGRLDFSGKVPAEDFDVVVNVESWRPQAKEFERSLRLVATVVNGVMVAWMVSDSVADKKLASSAVPARSNVRIVVKRNFEFLLPLAWLTSAVGPAPASVGAISEANYPAVNRLRIRFSLFRNHLPIDSLPVEGWVELHVLSEAELMSMA